MLLVLGMTEAEQRVATHQWADLQCSSCASGKRKVACSRAIECIMEGRLPPLLLMFVAWAIMALASVFITVHPVHALASRNT